MKIMGRVARLILLVVMFVCVVFCVLCCLQNNLVFLSVTYLNIKKWKLWAMYFNGFLRYDRKKKSSSHLSGKKKRYSRLSVRCVVLAITTGKKKVPVVCLARCAVVVLAITTGKKKSSSRLSGGLSVFWFWRLRPEKKKVPVVCLAGCQFLVLAITTGKKKVPVVCLAG